MSAPQKRTYHPEEITALSLQIKVWAAELGFQSLAIADTDLSLAEHRLKSWLHAGYHGEMEWMARHGSKRTRPAELVESTVRVISVRMDYLPDTDEAWNVIHDASRAFISRYALGRDYHKLMRQRLQQLADRIRQHIGEFGYRVFVDSAPVMEKALAEKAGLGWVGKHTNLIHREHGSWFFLGEIYTDVPLTIDPIEAVSHCGTCDACITACPTNAIIAPYQLDARRCISYLTIELAGSIPVEFRKAMGNRIYGCDDCQLVCPWNRFARFTLESDFLPRQQLNDISLLEVFSWNEQTFLKKTEGSAIRRIGYERWLRNIAVALGNAPTEAGIVTALQQRLQHTTPLVQEHIVWALTQHGLSP